MKIAGKTVAHLMGVVSLIALSVLYSFPGRFGFFLTLLLWLLFLLLGEWATHRGHRHENRASHVLIVTALSFVGFITLIEFKFLLWLLVVLGALAMFILFQTIITEGKTLALQKKSVRRFMMVIWVFDTYALLTTFYAINLFFPALPFALLVFLSGILIAYSSYMIWSMYYPLKLKDSWLWTLVVSLAMMELFWVLRLMPFGYLAAGFLVTWVWYVLQLFVRFHFSPKGINWKKQRVFLIANLLLYALVLIFFVRWV